MNTNLDVLKTMSADEFAIFMEDAENFDNPDWEWKSRIQPPLPFDTWSDWLNKEAEYGIN